jgi:hypothetical protein
VKFIKSRVWLGKIVFYLYINLRVNIAWYKIYRLFSERNKKANLKRFDTFYDMIDYVRTLKWSMDKWYKLWDAWASAEKIQWSANNSDKKHIGDCDEFATYQSAIITNELKTNPFFGSDFGLIKSAKVLTVAWLKTGGRTWQGNELGYGGHNVCLIEFRDGTFAYMDYGLPSKNVESIELVAKQVLGVYSPISECIGLAITGLDLKLHNYKFGV